MRTTYYKCIHHDKKPEQEHRMLAAVVNEDDMPSCSCGAWFRKYRSSDESDTSVPDLLKKEATQCFL